MNYYIVYKNGKEVSDWFETLKEAQDFIEQNDKQESDVFYIKIEEDYGVGEEEYNEAMVRYE
jgi:ABC-type nitrate/sulfonate/bicarbonate transport system substrate-binding protein